MNKQRIINFYKKYFTEVKEELLNDEELILVPDENFPDEDNEVIEYLDAENMIFSNKEILEMIDS